MSEDIREKWKIAQREERRIHDVHSNDMKQGLIDYESTYLQYFEKLQTSFTQNGKTILEIGPADFPAVFYCDGYIQAHIIEPLPSPFLKSLLTKKPYITLYDVPAEDMEFPKVDEVWILNVLQHTMNPGLILDKAKKAAKVIRFFEPINDDTDICHLHSFTADYFRSFFGDVVKIHTASKGILRNFHEKECAYGVWHKHPQLAGR